MSSYNKVVLMGNLTRDPETRVLAGGTAIAKLGMAVNRKWTDQGGQAQEEVTFVDVDFFGKSAETLTKYMSKGDPLLIEGRLKLDQWVDKTTGDRRQRLGVVGERFAFVGGRARGQTIAPATPESAPQGVEEDVPF
jgi:single-strand DNA-binding protein